MRVGFYVGEIQDEKNGGGHTFQVSLIEGLIMAKCEHEFYVYYRCNKNLFKTSENVKFINMNFEYIPKIEKKLFRRKKRRHESDLNTLILRDKIELVYHITPSAPQVEVPYVFTVWDLAHKEMTFFPEVSNAGWTFEEREKNYISMIPKSSYTVIGNNEGKRQVCQYYNMNEDRVKIIPMPTPNDVSSTQPDTSVLEKYKLEKNKYLFYPAQFWPHKNHIRLVKAIKKLKEQNYDFKMVFTGSDFGNEKYIKQIVKDFGLKEDVLFLGFVTREEIIALYKNAFALVYASLLGPDNIPPLEAMALKCPVISSGITGMREQLNDCALFFDPLDENDLIDKLKLLENEELKQKLISKGEVLSKSCCVDNYVNKMIEIIDEFAPIRECWSSIEKYVHL